MPVRTTPKVRYEPVLLLPPLPEDQYAALRENIALHGVLVPILVDGRGPRRKIIDGNHRKAIADELGYDCPEVVQEGLGEDDKRTLARALNLARRQLSTEQKRQLIADQLAETPGRSNRWVAKALGVSHPTVASVRVELEGAGGKLFQLDRHVGADGKSYRAAKKPCPFG
jgi:ParB-like chromosome segregation protein Spo0J